VFFFLIRKLSIYRYYFPLTSFNPTLFSYLNTLKTPMRTKCQALAQRHRTQTITHPKPTQHLRSKSLGCRPKAEPQLMKANLAGTLHHSPVLTAGGHEHIVSGETWSCLPGSTSMWCKGRTCSRVEIWAPIPSHGLLRSWLLFLNHTTLSFSLQ